MESFALQELRKLIDFSHMTITPYHFRTAGGKEVDIVLEGPERAVVGIEVKASANVRHSDFTGLQALAEAAGSKFRRGVLIYLGDKVLPFGDKLNAMPVSALWSKSRP
ncbi:MAG: DUF4143 domain-containing protein [Mariprofundales bacterium]|nr:DUF4143 domain-containing protein [Mariprofundales bacterium]